MESNDWVRRFNYLGDAVGGARHLISLDPDELIKIATLNSRLSDFGEDDWLPGYYATLGALHKSDILHTIGRLLTRGRILQALQNRLFIIEKIKREPEINNEVIIAPIFIIGNPRTGTTVLFEILAQDPRFRAPLSWEASCPIVPPKHALPANISQCEIAQSVNDLFMDIQPLMRPMHELRWSNPAECLQIMDINCIPRFDFDESSSIASALDCANNYVWHKRVLQVLQHKERKRTWLLKCPSHINFIDRILQHYPDARFIFTHRDPAKSAPSILQLSQYYRSTLTNEYAHKNPERILAYLDASARNVIHEYENGNLSRSPLSNLLFSNFMENPISSIKETYEDLGITPYSDIEEKTLLYLKNKPRYKNGEYTCRAEDFGLTDREIRDQFSSYINYYKIPLEN